MNGKPKSWRALRRAAHCAVIPTGLDPKGRGFLTLLAEYADKVDGSGAHPGNQALQAAVSLKWSACHELLKKYIAAGLIEPTFIPHGRPSKAGEAKATVWRLCLENEAYPDYAPNGEKLSEMPDNNGPENIRPNRMNTEKTSGPAEENVRPEAENVRPEAEKHPVEAEKTSGLLRSTSVTHLNHTNPTPTPQAEKNFIVKPGGVEGWIFENLTAMNNDKPNPAQLAAITTLAEEIGPKNMQPLLNEFLKRRDGNGVQGLNKVNAWKVFLDEAPLNQTFIKKQAAEKARRAAAEAATEARIVEEVRIAQEKLANAKKPNEDTSGFDAGPLPSNASIPEIIAHETARREARRKRFSKAAAPIAEGSATDYFKDQTPLQKHLIALAKETSLGAIIEKREKENPETVDDVSPEEAIKDFLESK